MPKQRPSKESPSKKQEKDKKEKEKVKEKEKEEKSKKGKSKGKDAGKSVRPPTKKAKKDVKHVFTSAEGVSYTEEELNDMEEAIFKNIVGRNSNCVYFVDEQFARQLFTKIGRAHV